MNLSAEEVAAVERAAVIIRQRHGKPWVVTWRYVSGGRVLHAFLGDAMVPVCGERALRGPLHLRREPKWLDTPTTARNWAAAVKTMKWRRQHRRCAQLATVRADEITVDMRRLQRELVAQILAGEL